MDRVVVIDVETSGLDPVSDHVVELAAVDLSDDRRASTLVEPPPGTVIDPQASAVHHLVAGDLVGQPTLEEAWRLCVPSDAAAYAAHNADFDARFLDGVADPGVPWVCTWRCASHLWPDAPAHGNQALRYWLQDWGNPELPAGLAPHRALYDAVVTAQHLRIMLRGRSVAELAELTRTPLLLERVRFGKYRGTLWSAVPHDYLRWVLSQDFDADVVHTARHHLGV